MKLTVFGATGGVGQQIVSQALDRGHSVTAVVRDAARLPIKNSALTVAALPTLDRVDELVPVVGGADAVLSAIGPRERSDKGVVSTCTRVIVRAMVLSGVGRFVGVSAVPVGPVPKGDSLVNRWLLLPAISTVLRSVYSDLAEMEADLQNSAINWTVVRPPKLTDKPFTGKYRIALGANVARGYSVARADVAELMLNALDQPATQRQAVGIAY